MEVLHCCHVLLRVTLGSPFAFRRLWMVWGLFFACTLLFQVSQPLLRMDCPLVSCPPPAFFFGLGIFYLFCRLISRGWETKGNEDRAATHLKWGRKDRAANTGDLALVLVISLVWSHPCHMVPCLPFPLILFPAARRTLLKMQIWSHESPASHHLQVCVSSWQAHSLSCPSHHPSFISCCSLTNTECLEALDGVRFVCTHLVLSSLSASS